MATTDPKKAAAAAAAASAGKKGAAKISKTGKGGKTQTSTPKTSTTTPKTTPKYSYTYGNQMSKSDSASAAFDIKRYGNPKNPQTTVWKGDKGLEEKTIYTAKDPKTGRTIQTDAFSWKKMQQQYNIPASQWKQSKQQRTVSRKANP